MKGFIVKSILLVLVVIIGVLIGAQVALVRGVPNIEEIKGFVPASSTRIYADDDTLIGEFKVEKGVYVSIDKIPEHMIKALVAVEDSRFWQHKGVDYLAILRAVFKDILAGRIKEGASTITQQLAKVVFLSPEKTVIRKLKEATLAYRLEKNLTKEEILELYLNKIYFGHGAYGVEMAARSYFGKSISEIDLAEAALLCGLIKAPSRYTPYNNLDKAKQRQMVVLNRMKEEGYITQEQADEAYQQPLYLTSARQEQYTNNYFIEYIRKHLEDTYGVEMTYKGGLKVYTTLNRKMQLAAVNSLKDGLLALDKRHGFRGPVGHKEINLQEELEKLAPFEKVVMREGDIMTATVLTVSPYEATVKTMGIVGQLLLSDAQWADRLVDPKGRLIRKLRYNLTSFLKPGDIIKVRLKDRKGGRPVFSLEQDPLVQGAVVAIETSTGYIRAIAGGYDFNESEFNRAMSARRQAGSAFKPIIYAAAMDSGFTPASVIIDEPLVYESAKYGDWRPGNYDNKFHGATRLREALAYSRNIVTIKLLEEIGVDKVVKFARTLGIEGPFPRNLTLGLGSLSVSPLELTSAFGVFARGGTRMPHIAVKYVVDSGGKVLENNIPGGQSVISPQTAFLATSMLEDVVKYGTGKRARALNRPAAGKTGTTNEYKDAWFIGYTPELVAGVWVGYDDARTLGHGETGSRAASPIWVSFMTEALSEISSYDGGAAEKRAFPVPDGIVTAVIDPVTGLLATNATEKMVEFFKEGTVPAIHATDVYRNLILKQKEALLKTSKGQDVEDDSID
ncbi:MAG: PBP1A family penicillin-binding protein [Nitrospiraceae bacterium]|nr:MAG: PBP1A family penicillin-binding protein [Nitrospiraceae bacterium]